MKRNHRSLTPTASRVLPVLSLAAVLCLTGCVHYLQPFAVEPARPGAAGEATAILEHLPPPAEKIVVGVYGFRDQTGQYKPSASISYSTAVTQGATSILIRALEASGWFVPIEREGLNNLMNERQIIQSVRAQHGEPEDEAIEPLPPLLYAGVLLEGGIIGYDSNVLTGGAGARYFGAGGSGQFRQDQVTVYLRAVSTQSGRILKTVHATKTILSQQISASLFRFVEPARLLEAEAGYSFNEPAVVAVTAAIEAAVRSLIVEGIRDRLWALADPAASAELFAAFDRSVEDANTRSFFGRVLRPNRPGLGVGVAGGAARYEGNYRNALVRPTAAAYVRAGLTPRLALGLSASAGETAAERAFSTPHVTAEVHALYYALPHSRLTPYLTLGAGVLAQGPELTYGRDLFPYAVAGIGLEYMLTPRIGFSMAMESRYALVEGLDGIRLGRIHDSLWSVTTGLTFYPF